MIKIPLIPMIRMIPTHATLNPIGLTLITGSLQDRLITGI